MGAPGDEGRWEGETAGTQRPAWSVRVGWWVALAGVVLAAAGQAPMRQQWRAWQERRAYRFTEDGYRSWRQGDLRAAELAFESASAVAPEALRPLLLQGRMYLATGNRAQGHAVFRGALRAQTGGVRAMIAANYHDALLGTACWAELAALAMEELARRPVADPVWIQAAVEGLRWAKLPPAEWQKLARALPLLHPIARALIRVRVALSDGRGEAINAEVDAVAAALPPPLSLTLARLWLAAGRPEEARLALAHVDRALTPEEMAQAAMVLIRREPQLAVRAAEELCAAPHSRQRELGSILVGLSLALAEPDAAVAAAYSRGLEPVQARLETETIGAVWLCCELAGLDDDAQRWRDRLTRRMNDVPLPHHFLPLNQNRFRAIVNAVPLRRDTVYGLLGALGGTERTGVPAGP